MQTFFLLFFALFSVSTVSAQGGIADGLFKSSSEQDPVLKNAPKLEIPKEARESGFGGRVRVRVAIDEAGKVTSAEVASGPGPVCPAATRPDVDAMRRAAKASALKTIFSPATKDGKPVRSAMLLNYDFPATKEWNKFGTYKGGAKLAVESTPNENAGARIVSTDDKPPNPLGGGVLNGK